tara:strand:- start:9607 stop:10971 length:1365 start_codon:yes stop_codon:yes gene_type:complete
MLRVKKLTATDVHGYIPLNITFKSNLTFLTGSNGCGKTTALKLITAVLQPNFELLDEIKFADLKLRCWINEFLVDIMLDKNDMDGQREIKWTLVKKVRSKTKKDDQGEEFNGEFRLYPKFSFSRYNREEYSNVKENISFDFVNSKFYDLIFSFSNPIFLGIDRKIIGNARELERLRYRTKFGNIHKSGSVGFDHAQKVIIDYVGNIADSKKKYVEEFKSDIFTSLFKYLKYKNESSIFSFFNQKDLESKKQVTIQAINSLEMENEILEEVESYFDSLEKIQNKLNVGEKKIHENRPEDLNEWFMNRPHVQRIELVSKFAKEFQKKIDDLDYPLTEITKIVNSFFEESHKCIRIGANGAIHVDWAERGISTKNLSSGEIQLIVIITHLVFCEQNDEPTVFVIDEPELSLHISWQEKFVKAITEASPSTQFILATHSPAIISKLEYEKSCVYLKNV